MIRQSKDENRFKATIFKIILCASLIFYYCQPAQACTGFAVYGKKIYYGMNFDYPDVELKFVISNSTNWKIFQAYFVQNGNMSSICGMNAKGLFSTMQMLYPEVTSWTNPQLNEYTLYQAYMLALSTAINLQPTLDYINQNGIRIIHIPGTTLHNFFADTSGQAYVLEVGQGNNLITASENNFLVMTNFPNNQFVGKSLDEINGVGADRYKTAYQYIQANKDSFNFENGIETLQKTAQSGGGYSTQVSFLCDPVANEIFIVLKRNFTRIWKVSINDGTIETYSGFSQYKRIPIPETGISASELLSLTSAESNPDNLPNSIKLYQNYPNPFNPSTAISYSIPEANIVSLKVYDVLGNEIETLVDGYKQAGEYTVNFNASTTRAGLSAGVYIYCLKAGGTTISKKFVLLK